MDNTPEVRTTLHEIRTPLQTIISTLEFLEETKLDKEQKEYLHQLKFSTGVLLQITNNVLDFSKIENNSLKLEAIDVDVVTLAEDIADLISLECFSKGVELVTDIDYSICTSIIGDSIRLQQIILNLLKNAVKFTSKGYVCLNIERKESSIVFSIKDTGLGLSEEQKQNLFTEFYQASNDTARKYGGSGLGLSISKKLVHLMNGTIGVKDNTPSGSIFYFEIPVKYQGINFTNDLVISPDTRVLVVDDSAEAQLSMIRKLTSLGIKHTDTADSGEEALSKIRAMARENTPYTIAFIDLTLYKMDGWRLASLINADKEINDIKLVLMIPEGQIKKDAKMKLLGWYNSYIYKPIKRLNLVKCLSDVIDTPLDLEAVDDKAEETFHPQNTNELSILDFRSKITVIAADDHPINAKIMKRFIESIGDGEYSCIVAKDGQEAVELVKQNMSAPFVFMDINLPIKDGMQASRELRDAGYTGKIIACTANNDMDLKQSYINNGMDDLLIKPYQKSDITLIMEKYRSTKK